MGDLNKAQKKQFREALLSAFPNYDNLGIMVSYGLDKNLAVIVGGAGEPLETVAFNLINWAEAQGRIDELLDAAHSQNPGNSKLKKFYDEFVKQAANRPLDTDIPNLRTLGELHSFDLVDLVKGCKKKLLNSGAGGLVGFAVTTSEICLLECLGKRVKEVYRQRQRRISDKPLIAFSEQKPISSIVEGITKRIPQLKQEDQLWCVWTVDEEKANDFWQGLRRAIEGQNLERWLIVIMGVTSNCALPEDVVRLEWPGFELVDVDEWVAKIGENLNWPPEIVASAVDYIKVECGENDPLDTASVYEYVKAILENPDDFLGNLKERV